MNILQVIHGFLPQFRGGTELYLRGLCRELRRLDQDVGVFAGTTHSADEARVEHYDFDGMQVAQLVLAGSYLEHWTRGYSPDAARLFADGAPRHPRGLHPPRSLRHLPLLLPRHRGLLHRGAPRR